MSLYLATLGPIGYTYCPGTIATAATLPLVYLLRTWPIPELLYIMIIIISIMAAWFIIKRAMPYLDGPDPSAIVLDEFLGCLVTFIAIPISWKTIIIGFLLFRFFDITKYFGISRLEKLYGPGGIIIDDLFAAILSNVILRIGILYFT